MAGTLPAVDPDPEDAQADKSNPESDIDACVRRAERLKGNGNDYFRQKSWNEALVAYRSALGYLPQRKSKTKISPLTDESHESESVPSTETQKNSLPSSSDTEQCIQLRAILNGNIAACHVQLGELKESVDACSEALLDDPGYVKALQRRASSNDKLNTWSSLSSAQDDYNTLLKLLPSTSPQVQDVQKSLRLLKPRLETAQKKETGEMLDKLKGLGNSILGNFGLSTDNFKFEPNGQGGYSINFTR